MFERGHRYYGSVGDVGLTEKRERHVFIALGVLAVAAAAVKTYSDIKQNQQYQAEQKALGEQKKIEAQAAIETAAFEERQARRRTALALGKQRAITGAAGLSTTDGTPYLQEMDLTSQGELEALSIRRMGALQAATSTWEANIAKYRRQTAKGAVPLIAASGALQAASGAAGAYGSAQLYSSGAKPTVTSSSSGIGASRSY